MKTLTNLTTTVTDAPAISAGAGIINTQSQKGFSRQLNVTKSVVVAVASNGASAQIPIAELWKLFESTDANFVTPSLPSPAVK